MEGKPSSIPSPSSPLLGGGVGGGSREICNYPKLSWCLQWLLPTIASFPIFSLSFWFSFFYYFFFFLFLFCFFVSLFFFFFFICLLFSSYLDMISETLDRSTQRSGRDSGRGRAFPRPEDFPRGHLYETIMKTKTQPVLQPYLSFSFILFSLSFYGGIFQGALEENKSHNRHKEPKGIRNFGMQ